MAIPNFQTFIYPTLEVLEDNKEHKRKDLVKSVIGKFNFTEEELKETTKQGTLPKIEDRIQWSIVYLYKSPLVDKIGWGVYKITKEGQKILDDSSITNIDVDFLMRYPEFREFQAPTGLGDTEEDESNYWLYAPGEQANKWKFFYENGIMGIGWPLEDLKQYQSKEEIVKTLQKYYDNNNKYTNDSLALWQFANEIKVGDIVFAKKGVHEIIGYGIVESEYFYDELITIIIT